MEWINSSISFFTKLCQADTQHLMVKQYNQRNANDHCVETCKNVVVENISFLKCYTSVYLSRQSSYKSQTRRERLNQPLNSSYLLAQVWRISTRSLQGIKLSCTSTWWTGMELASLLTTGQFEQTVSRYHK